MDPKNPGWQKHLTPCQHTDPPISHCGMAFHYVKWHIVPSIQWPQCQITMLALWLFVSIKKPQCQITMLALWLSWPFDNAGFLV